MSKPFRILQICHKPPRPAVDGGCIAMDSLTTGMLLEGHQVKVLSLHTHKHPFKSSALDEAYLNATRFEAIYADTELNIRDAASHVITGESYHLSRCSRHRTFLQFDALAMLKSSFGLTM